jgi:hypothetical protein
MLAPTIYKSQPMTFLYLLLSLGVTYGQPVYPPTYGSPPPVYPLPPPYPAITPVGDPPSPPAVTPVGDPPYPPAHMPIASPPLPPVKPSGFPYCKCDSKSASRLSLDFSNNNKTTYCFRVKVADSCKNPSSPCCDMPLTKIDLKVSDSCNRATLQAVIIDNKSHSFVFNRNPNVLKITKLNYNNLKDLPICLKLNGDCRTLAAFCGGDVCWYSLFNQPTSGCCVTSYV